MELAKSAGASGIVFRIRKEEPYAMAYENVPFVWVNYRDAKKIRKYLRYAKLKFKLSVDCTSRYTIIIIVINFYFYGESCRFDVKAKILKSVRKLNETCQVVDFSSRGPNSITPEILKVRNCNYLNLNCSFMLD